METAHPAPQRDNAIVETLLALAKDTRYVQYCQSLIEDVLMPYRRTKPSESLFLASVLYATTVVLRTGRTLGMEACGVSFSQNTKKWRICSAFLTSAMWIYAIKRWSSAEDDVEEHSRQHGIGETTLSSSSVSPRWLNGSSTLRGDARRQYHEQQRQAMLRRARDADSSAEASTTNGHVSDSSCAFRGSARREGSGCWYRKIASKLIDALVTDVGPHMVPESSEGEPPSEDSAHRIGTWALRLHLAAFLLVGRFPSLMHRLWGLTMENSRGSQQQFIDQPTTTHRAVGMLILVQATTAFVKAVANTSISLWSQSRQRRLSLTSPYSCVAHNNDNNTESENAGSSATCGICRNERTHPAVPRSCGHVFCWKCLYHWVSSVRPECPLCRSACRPQDLVALHRYAPN